MGPTVTTHKRGRNKTVFGEKVAIATKSTESPRDSDRELVDRFKVGEERAFNEIVRRYQERIFAFVFRMVHDFDDASDLAQETFIRAHAKIGGFRGDSGLYTWLYRIALNIAINFLRKKKLRSFVGFDGLAETLASPGGPETDLQQSRLQHQVDAAVAQLPARQRSIFVLRYYDQMSHQEIARIVKRTEGNVRAGYFHAVKKLQVLLRDLVAK